MTTRSVSTFGSNALITVGTQVTVMAMGLGASVLISRALGASGRGEYYVPVTAVTVTFAVCHLSLEMAVRYFYAERLIELRRLASVSATMAVVAGGVGLLVLASPFLLGIDEIEGVQTSYVALAALALPFTIHGTWMMNLFVLGGRLGRSQKAVLVAALFQTGALLALWAVDGFSVERVLVVYVAAAACSWSILIVWSRSFAPAAPTLDRALLRRVVSHGAKIHVGFVAYFMLLRVDIFLIQGTLTIEDVGHYSLAVLFAELIGAIAAAIAVAGLPFQSTADRVEGASATFQTVRTCLLIAAFLAVLTASTMWFLLPLLYGHDFASSYGPMVALLPGVIAMTAVKPLWNWLVRDGRPAPISVLLAGGLVLNIALNLVLLPEIGLYGASVASSVSYGLLAFILAVWTLRNTAGHPSDLIPGRADVRAGVRVARRVLVGADRTRTSPADETGGPGEARP